MFCRLLLIVIVSSIFAYFKWTLLDSISDLVFAVASIVFSVAMSMVTGFNLNDVVWAEKRRDIKKALRMTRDELLLEFVMSLGFLCCSKAEYIKEIGSHPFFSLKTFSAIGIVVMLLFMIDKFRKIHDLNEDISEKIATEKSKRDKR